MTEFALIKVGDVEYPSILHDGVIQVPMRQSCETVGIPWQNEHRRIKNDPILSEAVINLMTPFSNGQEVMCLPLPFFIGWVFRLNLNTVAPIARPRIEALQREGYRVFYEYWTFGVARNPRFADGHERRPMSHAQMVVLFEKILKRTDPASRSFFYQILSIEARWAGVALAPLSEIGVEAPPAPDLIALLFEALDKLTIAGVPWDHSRNPKLSAVNPTEFAELNDKYALECPVTSALREAVRKAGIEKKAVNSGLNQGQTIYCWVFDRRPAPTIVEGKVIEGVAKIATAEAE
ncbi:MAG: phage antirepressor N-terminal domain-containing protein [Sphingomonas sp.]|nr:phage antirepressor N-terminal domain-containing protein [Sphingomonas sp.]